MASADGVGNVRRYTFRSVLPYDLVFDMRTTRAEPFRALDGTASGELIGEGRWRLMDDGPAKTLVRYDWEVSTAKEWMNAAAPLLRPAFAWNHDVIMGWGERGLRAYLAGKRLEPLTPGQAPGSRWRRGDQPRLAGPHRVSQPPRGGGPPVRQKRR